MASLSSTTKIPVKCPKCGHTTKKPLSELKPQATFTCACGTTITVNGDGFESAGKSLDDLQKTIAKLGRSLKR